MGKKMLSESESCQPLSFKPIDFFVDADDANVAADQKVFDDVGGGRVVANDDAGRLAVDDFHQFQKFVGLVVGDADLELDSTVDDGLKFPADDDKGSDLEENKELLEVIKTSQLKMAAGVRHLKCCQH